MRHHPQNQKECKQATYRPDRITSCVVKTVERMVLNRLNNLAKTRGWLYILPPKECTADTECSRWIVRELDTAIHAMRSKAAVGPDNIRPTFLIAHDPMAEAEVLSIFNESFSKSVGPGIWKQATILQLNKAGRPAGFISSYRPVNCATLHVVAHVNCTNWLLRLQKVFLLGVGREVWYRRTLRFGHLCSEFSGLVFTLLARSSRI